MLINQKEPKLISEKQQKEQNNNKNETNSSLLVGNAAHIQRMRFVARLTDAADKARGVAAEGAGGDRTLKIQKQTQKSERKKLCALIG